MTTEDKTLYHFDKSCAQFIYCESREQAIDMLVSVIDEAALDFETTALDPSDGKVRLTQICNDDVHFIIDHEFLGPIQDYLVYMEDKKWWVYNSKFESRWLDYLDGSVRWNTCDVDFLAKAVIGGYPSSLAYMCKRDLNITLDKDEQRSDWSAPTLTQSQINYAGFDPYVTWELKRYWSEQMTEGHWNGFNVFNDAVRPTIEAERTGLILDSNYHYKQVRRWEVKRDTFERYIRKWTPESVIKNLNSDQQVAKFLEAELSDSLLKVWPRTAKTKKMQMEGKYLKGVARRLPYPMSRWLAAVAGLKYYNKYLSTYGDTLITKQTLEGKITSRFNIGQASTGRYSSSSANLQNIPRKPVVRKAFYSPPKGTDVMTLADYKGVEVRVLAELSQDKQLLEDAIYGDVHSASAAQIFGLDLDLVMAVLAEPEKYPREYPLMKERRGKAKGFTFQLTYGAGPAALSDVLHCTYDEAIEAIQKWAARYPNAYGYRDKMFAIMNETGFLPVHDGRTIFINKWDRSMPVAANYPIQGAAASVMYRAMYRVQNRFIKYDLDCAIAATVHDELLAYAHKDDAEEVMTQQIKGMEEGWLDIFPDTNTDNLLDYKIGTSWADKP